MLHINENKASDAAAAVNLISNAYTWHFYFLPHLFQWSKATPQFVQGQRHVRGRSHGVLGQVKGGMGQPQHPAAQLTASSAGRWGWQPLGSLLSGSHWTPFACSAASQRPARKPRLLSTANPLQGKWAALWEYLARVCLWKAAAADRVKSTVSTLFIFQQRKKASNFSWDFY